MTPLRGSDHVHATLRAVRTDPARVRVTVDILVDPGWHVYGPGSSEGKPVALTADSERGHRLENIRLPKTADGLLSGRFEVQAELSTTDPDVTLVLAVQACNNVICEAPGSLRLEAAVKDPDRVPGQK
ncbi:hypothetical protein [Streptomyces sp. NPDC097610]|uniref:hypothetical protein n=1 Tax=Streptomyces sp. NPDC097610 TaxID=3157227 RepID=UPI00332A1619